jgi:hydrogenase small subunit
MGCKGPTTYNACATAKWNEGTSWPVEAGHGCIGCSEPRFWDAGSFYNALSVPYSDVGDTILKAGAAGLAVGAAAAVVNKVRKSSANSNRETITIKDLSKES